MASIAEKFNKIRIAPTFSLNRQNWVVSVMLDGWVWNDDINDWQITVGGVTYNGQDLLRSDWYEKQKQWRIENPKNDDVTYKRTGTYELRYDEELNAYYYFDTLGHRIYQDASDQNQLAELLIGKTILETPNYNFDEAINDILGRPINPRKPESGLYDTKEYLDSLTRTRKQYKVFWSATSKTEKIKTLEERATDIVSEEARIINLLSIAEKAKTTDNAIVNTISVVSSLFGGIVGKATAFTVKTAVSFAQKQTTDKRIQLLGEELKYIDEEYTAIKTYFEQNNANLNVTGSSGFGNWFMKNWGWIIAAIVSVSAMIYFIRKKLKKNEK